ncbi:hypothetical protein I315_02183 [Cryptococcus gattii Ru294]|uniref:Uncharacterized protein n=2 Tax=Cryptococcus gattii TaxID=37769 RepID=E6RDX3_CRYGW|nr:Hypothetical Protein CGB_K4010W [Cryptococcus gattii WM276]KIR54949.1 hypothetical protein I315_02183 [Cryptococcus gattii Ru294]KIR79080.1 hypothetical protein I306_03930 [Cryptococcus gattii EJB2]KIY35438.1 hypothetical protein I305_02348 [Cryptococcus gattii E566]KJD99760.1 hypothetical protein I311_06656 [Cryptococcus gattii NT-10]ADV25026.1 Hypothetical Protein CGB_K4010W [Cryptococcus gattii WM276]
MAKDFDTFPGFTDFRSLKPLKQRHFQKSSTLEQGRVNALHFAYELTIMTNTTTLSSIWQPK